MPSLTTITEIVKIGDALKEAIGLFAPALIVIFALITAYALIRWTKKLISAYIAITETPYGVLLFVIIVIILLFAWFAIAARFFN